MKLFISLFLVAILIVFGFVVAYTLQPVMQAWAYQTESFTDQTVADRILARTDKELTNDGTRESRINSKILVAYGTGLAIVIIVIGLAVSFGVYSIGKAKAEVFRAELLARCVPVDPTTRQYPLIIDNVANPRFAYNANNGELVRLDQPREYRKLLAQSSATVLAIGAEAAGRQKDGIVFSKSVNQPAKQY